MRKYQFAIILGIIILVTLVTFGIIIFNFKNVKSSEVNVVKSPIARQNYVEENQEKSIDYSIKTSNTETIKISPEATMIFDKYYKKCGHTVVVKEKVTQKMVNLTEREFAKIYNDWQLIRFSNNEIELKKEFEGECRRTL